MAAEAMAEGKEGRFMAKYYCVLFDADNTLLNFDAAVNLGTGKGSSVYDVLHSFEKACGKKLPYVVKPRRAGDLATCYADTAKAKKVFGWEAQYGLDEMTADSWNFIKNNPNGL